VITKKLQKYIVASVEYIIYYDHINYVHAPNKNICFFFLQSSSLRGSARPIRVISGGLRIILRVLVLKKCKMVVKMDVR